MTIGECIRAARKTAGLTQNELAIKSGVAAISIHQYESGKRLPRLEQFQSIANALNMSVSQLLVFRPEDLGGDPNNKDQMAFNRAVLDAIVKTDFDKTINAFLEKDARNILQFFERLNPEGQQKAIERVAELTEIPRYQKQENAAPGAVNTESGDEDIDE